jgi:uncharacterized protein YecE (DUF72 family)
MNVFVGTSGYSYPEWKGTFYPAKLPAGQMLGFYSARFRTVEINNTFYRPPTEQLLTAWAEQVPANFRFVLKAPQEITHVKRLRDTSALVTSLFAAADVLKNRLGAALFQLPPNFGKNVPLLRAFLAGLPTGARVAFEFRRQDWFCEEVFAALREHNAGLCVADAEDDLDVPFVATADWGYLRLRRPEYTDRVLTEWTDRLRAQNWRECYVFFKHEDSGTGPLLAARLLESLAGSQHRRAA